MQTLSEAQILDLIARREPFHARLRGGALRIRVDEYQPIICTVLHAGSRLTAPAAERLALDDGQRAGLEERGCDWLVELMPVTLICDDSRLEYDLNLPIAQSLPSELHGQALWAQTPTRRIVERSHHAYRRFYRILDALVQALEGDHDQCLLIDLHTGPASSDGLGLFHIITEPATSNCPPSVIKSLHQALEQIDLPHLEVRVSRGALFEQGAQLIDHIETSHDRTAAVSLVVAPVFIDPAKGTPYPILVDAIAHGLHDTLLQVAAQFAGQLSGRTVHVHDLMPRALPAEVLHIDRALKQLASGLETLLYINPINVGVEERHFLRSHGRYTPRFRYRQLKIDPYAHREQLYRLPVDSIREPALRQLYREVIDALAQRIDLLVSIGNERFLYNSLRYYGEPDDMDLANARFLLHAIERPEEEDQELFDAPAMLKFFSECAQRWELDCKTELSDRILAAAMVASGRKTLMVKRTASATLTEMHALAHHELGVHMTTSLNARLQPLKLFTLGLPGNTHAQEGLAILSEYLSGNLTLRRLKSLALRVVAVHQMLHHNDFRRTWRTLVEDYGCQPNEAFKVSARVHRGGGFTKDYLYLSGFRQALSIYRSEDQQLNIRGLLIGKTGFSFLPLLNELLERELVTPPRYLPPAVVDPAPAHPEIDYLVRSIR